MRRDIHYPHIFLTLSTWKEQKKERNETNLQNKHLNTPPLITSSQQITIVKERERRKETKRQNNGIFFYHIHIMKRSWHTEFMAAWMPNQMPRGTIRFCGLIPGDVGYRCLRRNRFWFQDGDSGCMKLLRYRYCWSCPVISTEYVSVTLTKVSLSRRYFAAISRATPPAVALGSKEAFPAAWIRRESKKKGGDLKKRRNTMMIGSRESLEIVVCLDSSRVLTLGISNGSSILCQPALHNIISNIPTDKEPLIGDDSVSIKSRSLEQIQKGTGVECLLSIMQSDLCVLWGDGGEESCS